jgi:hypothetical protein
MSQTRFGKVLVGALFFPWVGHTPGNRRGIGRRDFGFRFDVPEMAAVINDFRPGSENPIGKTGGASQGYR